MADLSNKELLNIVRAKNLERFDVNPKYAGLVLDGMGDWISLMESDRNPKAKNIPQKGKEATTASGAYQYTADSTRTAVNRLKNTVGNKLLPSWAKDVYKSGDASTLSLDKQKILFEADTFQKDGSDLLLNKIFAGDTDAVEDLYTDLHHTNADDKTYARIDNLRNQLNIPSTTVMALPVSPPQEPVLASDLIEEVPQMDLSQAVPKANPMRNKNEGPTGQRAFDDVLRDLNVEVRRLGGRI
mgnify:FL=1